jgi:seryl-tRNA synthetase
MIDLVDLRANPERYRTACAKKRMKFDIDAFLELDKQYREKKTALETLRAEQNRVSKEMPKLQGADKERALAEMKLVAARLKEDGATFTEIETRWNRDQLFIPAPALPQVPEGATDSDNVEIRKVGAIPSFPFKIRDHAELGKQLDILDIERGVKIAGSRSYFLKGDGARLQHAVMSCAIDFLTKRGFTLFDPPHVVHYNAMMGTSYFPGGEENAYHLDDRDKEFYLIGTAEVPVTAYHMDEILEESTLPRRYAGYSPCYRREAGTYGKDTQGIYRVHQFYKVEQVIVCKNDAAESAARHAELLKNAEDFLQLLQIPYRVVDVCTGDMGQGQVYKNDIESWMPSRNSYGETHSCSTFHEFQARRLKLRYRNGQGKTEICHTLNNTFVANPRFLIPLLELNQQADGSIRIPAPLQPYMGGQEIIVAPGQ